MGGWSRDRPSLTTMALPMKKGTAMKKVMKAKRVSKIAKGKRSKALVLRGSKEKTASGLTKDQLMRNKRGKIVSKKSNATRRKLYQKSTNKIWADCVTLARKALNLKGFVAINGKAAEGKALYAKAKALYAERK